MAKHRPDRTAAKEAKTAKLVQKSKEQSQKLASLSASAAVEEAWKSKPEHPKAKSDSAEGRVKGGKKRKLAALEPAADEPATDRKPRRTKGDQKQTATREEAGEKSVQKKAKSTSATVDANESNEGTARTKLKKGKEPPGSAVRSEVRTGLQANANFTSTSSKLPAKQSGSEIGRDQKDDGGQLENKRTKQRDKKKNKSKDQNKTKEKQEKGSASPPSLPDHVQKVIDSLLDASIPGTLSDRLNADHPHFDKQLRASWKSFSKKERASIVAADQNRLKGLALQAEAALQPLPFNADDDDHCETAPEAYQDLAPILGKIAKKLGKTPGDLKIYDPYYCAGAVVGHLTKVGFPNVYNRCEDFYDVLAKGQVPQHDVLVTNPPYSGEHVERLLNFARSNGKPFFLLMPNYFCAKSYYAAALGEALTGMVYLFPQKRYVYWTPKGRRAKDKIQSQHSRAGGNRTSPFISFWYINTAPALRTESLLKWWRDPASTGKAPPSPASASASASSTASSKPTLAPLDELPPAALKDCSPDAVLAALKTRGARRV